MRQGRVYGLLILCLSVAGDCLTAQAAPPALSPAAPSPAPAAHPAPSAAQPSHAASPAPPQTPSTPASSGKPNDATPSAGNRPAVPDSSAASSDQTGRPVRPDPGDHHHHHELPYYPLGTSFNYWNPDWSPYNDAYGYDDNQPNYPGQFEQSSADNADPNAQSANEVLVTPSPAQGEVITPQLRTALMNSPPWRDADERVKVAQAGYEIAKARVISQLKTKPEYQQAVARKNQDAQQVDSLKTKDPSALMTRTESVATAKLDAAKAVTDMETAALAADPQASAAKMQLDSALAQRDEARQSVEAALTRPGSQSPPAPHASP